MSFEALATAHLEGRKLDYAEFELLCSRAGRVHGPDLLLDAWEVTSVIDNTVLTASIAGIWSAAEFPETAFADDDGEAEAEDSHWTWLGLFKAAGFTRDGKPAPRPRKRVHLYRGCVPERQRGMSWTTDLAEAGRFACKEL
ncbi:MAG TPA: hypothetical protein VFV41_17360, partial [Streptosporangiaceae bacterium]|nr:hypothetical protein [Streptosporangiaceae bacterium]